MFFNNDYLTLFNKDGDLIIQVFKKGYDVKEFNSIVLDFPNMQVANFTNLKNSLTEADSLKVSIGVVKPRIEVLISDKDMKAKIKLNITAREFANNTIEISSEIVSALKLAGVSEGLDTIFSKPITVGKEIFIATGIPPINGKEAIITYIDIAEKKPVIRDDGKVNYYELNLIDSVKEGDWLGEKIPATKGTPGKTVTGVIIPARQGRDANLKFDAKTVYLHTEGEKSVLRAGRDGAVMIDSGKIRVDNLLVIRGDVDYATGNIQFDGYVTIEGTVKDGFSVIAKNDIAINSLMGLGQIGLIESKEGSVFIKGGIYGKNKAKIIARKNVYIKYTNEASIAAGEEINIGFYSLDSELNGRNIILDPVYGKIIGGRATAQVQIISGTIGSKAEKKTVINVKGFNRADIKTQFEALLLKYKKLVLEVNKSKRHMDVLEKSLAGSEYSNMEEYNDLHRAHDKILEEVAEMESERKKLQKVLETRGDGEIEIMKAAFPETYLEIKEMTKKIDKMVSGSFYFEDSEMHHK